jgi:hypothetical protein
MESVAAQKIITWPGFQRTIFRRLEKSVHETVFRAAMNRLDDFYASNKYLAAAASSSSSSGKQRLPFHIVHQGVFATVTLTQHCYRTVP